jgi:mRNA-degrading endonuclease RelE of RelBE toxin-antitoxin system
MNADPHPMATVVLTPEAVRDIAGLPAPIITRLHGLVARLRQWPEVSGVKRLKGDLAGKFRLRTGDYRLQFRVERITKVSEEKKKVKGQEVVERRASVDYRLIVEKAGHHDGFNDE